MGTKGRLTQKLANAFPSWSNIRVDEQSLGFQYLNIIGQRFDDMYKQLDRIGSNYFLPTAVVSDLDLFYSIQLPGSFEFTKAANDDTGFLYTPPTISGIVTDGTRYTVTVVSGNDIESFWNDAVPSRISLDQTVTGDHLLASGLVTASPFSPFADPPYPNQLTIKLDGGISYLELLDNNLVRKGLIQIEGINRQGQEVKEELIFLYDETRKTTHEYQSVTCSGIHIYGVEEPESTMCYVKSANFRDTDYPINYQLDTTADRDDMPLFWGLGTSLAGTVNTLDLKKYETDDLDLRLEGWVDKYSLLQQELLNKSSINISPRDLSPEPYSDRIWVVDSGTLYLYNANLPYFDATLLTTKQYAASSVIEPSSYYAVLGDTIELDYIWRKPTTGMTSHRVWVQKPDGNKYSLEDGVEIAYHTDSTSWIFGEPRKRTIRNAETYVLDQRGSYIYNLEVRYTDDTTSIDQRIVTVVYQSPQKEYSLLEAGIPVAASGIDIDSEYKLWVLGMDGTKYQIGLHYDNAMIDWDRKIVYFREPYIQVRVI